ncbi:Stp1/IreP family PP2C-type Ser/Thr phosphatase [Haloimpatiens lingqiaonensis]|uniref:Stp1/IreP family PP2C-type Ser/Thr phosphatase n=1 Tax=Haloimpatiens lingqiaonensis TaxID=1380675 RepID=UPI0010FF1295|nr:Stp1/IreP family PP2C-type Ser/Thr phosphatase [Haloimpatiens lingqiaonensis]
MVGMLSDVGNKRRNNQDYIGVYEDSHKRVYIVADGMGGHNAGEVASKTAVEKIIEYIGKKYKGENPSSIITEAIKYANEAIFHIACEEDKYKGMGTTVTACFIVDNHMFVGHVGDSSCYIVKNDGYLYKITKDHSLVQELVDKGAISEDEAFTHPNRNVITRAVGTKFLVKVDIFHVDLKEVKKVVLCTDGLTKEMKDEEILSVVKKHSDNQQICDVLLEKCKIRGANDNISVIVFEGECK